MNDYPKLSIVTPSYNQAAFLERTIRSVVTQNYPNLEYIVVDGGSSDGSLDIIRRYEAQISRWISEPDGGQVHAINKGLRMATGDWVAWQNSDDVYYPAALHAAAEAIRINPNADIIVGNIMLIDENDKKIRDIHYVRPTYRSMLAEGMVLTNQAAFWRRSVHREVGFLDESLDYAFDYEWFLRLIKDHRAVHVNRILGGYRLHEETKTSQYGQRFVDENRRILQGRQVSSLLRHAYQMRRFALLLAQGNIRYVVRGLCRRARIRVGHPS